MEYMAADSLVRLLHSPVLWSDSNQFLSDTVLVFLQEDAIREVRLIGHAFVCENLLADIHFNQIKSPRIVVYFKENKPEHAIAEPHAECLYYIFEKDTELVGIHQAEAERMRMEFKNNELQTITFYKQIKGEFGPDPMSDKRYLPDFLWLGNIRPKEKQAIFLPDHHERAIAKEEEEDEE